MNNETKTPDCRAFGYRSPRIAVKCRLAITTFSPQETIVAECCDMSEDGLAAELRQFLTPGEQVTITLRFPGAEALMMPARVEYWQRGRCGLAFLFSSSEERERIKELVVSLAKDSPPSHGQT